MKFNETLIYRVLSIPGEEYEKGCGYIFALKVPTLFLIMVAGVPMALIFDIVNASMNVVRDASRRVSCEKGER